MPSTLCEKEAPTAAAKVTGTFIKEIRFSSLPRGTPSPASTSGTLVVSRYMSASRLYTVLAELFAVICGDADEQVPVKAKQA